MHQDGQLAPQDMHHTPHPFSWGQILNVLGSYAKRQTFTSGYPSNSLPSFRSLCCTIPSRWIQPHMHTRDIIGCEGYEVATSHLTKSEATVRQAHNLGQILGDYKLQQQDDSIYTASLAATPVAASYTLRSITSIMHVTMDSLPQYIVPAHSSDNGPKCWSWKLCKQRFHKEGAAATLDWNAWSAYMQVLRFSRALKLDDAGNGGVHVWFIIFCTYAVARPLFGPCARAQHTEDERNNDHLCSTSEDQQSHVTRNRFDWVLEQKLWSKLSQCFVKKNLSNLLIVQTSNFHN